jgi:hypothetical protein
MADWQHSFLQVDGNILLMFETLLQRLVLARLLHRMGLWTELIHRFKNSAPALRLPRAIAFHLQSYKYVEPVTRFANGILLDEARDLG